MGFGKLQSSTVELSPAAAASLYGQSRSFELPKQCPACRINCYGISERLFRLCQDFLQQLRLSLQKHLDWEITLILVTLAATQRQVGNPIASSFGLGDDMLDFKGGIPCRAILAGTLILFE